jgi:gas vesicle protein
MGGLALLAASFRKGGILGALGGAVGGALTGFEIAGPIGALIGGIIGLISGIWGKSTKKARLAIEAQIKQKSKDIEDAYNLFQMDWSTSRDQLEQLRAQGVDALRQAGVKDISRSRVGHVDQWVDKAEKEIDATQAERNRRGALVFGPPEFHRGGIVAPELALLSPGIPGARLYHSGGEVNANLLVGEGVLTRRGMRSVGGEAGLNRLNAGGAGGDTYNFNITAWDGKSVDEWLSAGGMDKIARAHRRGVHEGRY